MKFDSRGKALWQVGNHVSSDASAFRGQTHLPIGVAGFVDGGAGPVVGVADYFKVPCHFWTADDGLFLGTLLDGRVEDGLPARAYKWWNAGTDDFDAQTGRALFQYDLAVGGQLAKLPNGDIIFMGAGWNNVPCYKVHGLDKLTRQGGMITIAPEEKIARAEQAGKGLKGEYFDGLNLHSGDKPLTAIDKTRRPRLVEGVKDDLADDVRLDEHDATPIVRRNDARIWFGFPANNEYNWPGEVAGLKQFSARWKGSIEPRFTEEYQFSVYATGGVKLWLGERLMIDAWSNVQSAKLTAKPIALQVGKKTPIRIEFNGQASKGRHELHLIWESATQGVEHVPGVYLYP